MPSLERPSLTPGQVGSPQREGVCSREARPLRGAQPGSVWPCRPTLPQPRPPTRTAPLKPRGRKATPHSQRPSGANSTGRGAGPPVARIWPERRAQGPRRGPRSPPACPAGTATQPRTGRCLLGLQDKPRTNFSWRNRAQSGSGKRPAEASPPAPRAGLTEADQGLRPLTRLSSDTQRGAAPAGRALDRQCANQNQSPRDWPPAPRTEGVPRRARMSVEIKEGPRGRPRSRRPGLQATGPLPTPPPQAGVSLQRAAGEHTRGPEKAGLPSGRISETRPPFDRRGYSPRLRCLPWGAGKQKLELQAG